MKGLTHIQNDNNEYFGRCLVRYVNPVSKIPAKVRNVEK